MEAKRQRPGHTLPNMAFSAERANQHSEQQKEAFYQFTKRFLTGLILISLVCTLAYEAIMAGLYAKGLWLLTVLPYPHYLMAPQFYLITAATVAVCSALIYAYFCLSDMNHNNALAKELMLEVDECYFMPESDVELTEGSSYAFVNSAIGQRPSSPDCSPPATILNSSKAKKPCNPPQNNARIANNSGDSGETIKTEFGLPEERPDLDKLIAEALTYGK